ncbi:hypothetical protein BKA65DRAFT_479602 [Rhexocercosporidium sp. MPI-PUGE-AT-0058]|nr:hypothetical protein BKA65DRAFT_479602 [Rhexocercosporidium sp. MPI-PUGE-AT-0058]
MNQVTDTNSERLLSCQSSSSLEPLSKGDFDKLKGFETWKRGLVKRRSSCLCQQLTPWVTYLFIALFVSSQAAIVLMLRSNRFSPQLLGEVNGLIPNVATKIVKFERNPTHNALEEHDASWLNIMPIGGGFIIPKKRGDMVLPPPMKIHGEEVYSISVFHQLHCLHSILEGFNNPRYNRTAHHHGVETQADVVKHMEHCFDYLRQSIMCCGDTALEGQSTLFTEAGTSGEDSHHMCKNYEQLLTLAETHRASDQRGYE